MEKNSSVVWMHLCYNPSCMETCTWNRFSTQQLSKLAKYCSKDSDKESSSCANNPKDPPERVDATSDTIRPGTSCKEAIYDFWQMARSDFQCLLCGWLKGPKTLSEIKEIACGNVACASHLGQLVSLQEINPPKRIEVMAYENTNDSSLLIFETTPR